MKEAPVKLGSHAIRLALIVSFAAAILGWTATHTALIWPDGLRYIAQAKEFEGGLTREKLSRAVDHPAYPLAIASIHRLVGGTAPASWQAAAQIAAIASALLLLIPFYLVALELFGETTAWLASTLLVVIPATEHTFADALSESTFLLFWMWGLWFALRFFRRGNAVWLLPLVIASGLAYLSRPEGLLLPAALIATLGLMTVIPSSRLSWPRWWLAVSLLVIGPAVSAMPFVVMRGGIGTKPAVARLFGLAPKSPGMAIERDRPVADDQTVGETVVLAVRAMFRAINQAVTPLLLLLAPLGFVAARRRSHSRSRLFVGIVLVCWILALVRLHATGGYCTPRHALIAALLLVMAGGAGLGWLLQSGFDRLERAGRIALGKRSRLQPLSLAAFVLGFASFWAPETLAPLNQGFAAYRQAGEWLGSHSSPEQKVVDLKGWALFYGQKSGYGFSRIGEGFNDRQLRWVVAHDSFLTGPWFYCEFLRKMLQGREPVASFPKVPVRGVARVHVFDLAQPPPPEGQRATALRPRAQSHAR